MTLEDVETAGVSSETPSPHKTSQDHVSQSAKNPELPTSSLLENTTSDVITTTSNEKKETVIRSLHPSEEYDPPNNLDPEDVSNDNNIAPSIDKKTGVIQKLTKRRHHLNERPIDGIFLYDDDNYGMEDHEESGIALSTIKNSNGIGDDDTVSVVSGNWSTESTGSDPSSHHKDRGGRNRQRRNKNNRVGMSAADIAVCQKLDAEYDRSLEEQDVTFTARYQSVRQSTCLSLVFMALFMVLGTIFFERQSPDWGLQESLLFTVYTITTVGYGHLETPNTPVFQLYTIFFIFIGIAILTIMVAQVYQCIALEATRAATYTDSRSSMRIWLAAKIESSKQQQQHKHTVNMHHRTTNRSDDESNQYHLDTQYDNENVDFWPNLMERILYYFDLLATFFRENEIGRGLSVLLPFVSLIGVGAMVIGPLEGWTMLEAIYFSVVSLTTVGFGDYYPTKPASVWFCIIWLPFSIGFLSMYLGNVAAFYIRLSDKNIERIESHLRRGIQARKERAEQDRLIVLERAMRGQQLKKHSKLQKKNSSSNDTEVVGSDLHLNISNDNETSDAKFERESNGIKLRKVATRLRGFASVPINEGSGHNPDAIASNISKKQALSRREKILRNSITFAAQKQSSKIHSSTEYEDDQKRGSSSDSFSDSNMTTMKDVLRAIHENNSGGTSRKVRSYSSDDDSIIAKGKVASFHSGPESAYLSVRSSAVMKDSFHTSQARSVLKPSFALRALVQERFAEIIATDIAGHLSKIEIKEFTLSVTIKTLKQTADKWLVPRRARKAFRSVAFEALYFVGERALVTRGADALLSLTPHEFHQIFSPLIAAFGDAETMEDWISHTDVLADVDLRGTNIIDIDPLTSLTGSLSSSIKMEYENDHDGVV